MILTGEELREGNSRAQALDGRVHIARIAEVLEADGQRELDGARISQRMTLCGKKTTHRLSKLRVVHVLQELNRC